MVSDRPIEVTGSPPPPAGRRNTRDAVHPPAPALDGGPHPATVPSRAEPDESSAKPAGAAVHVTGRALTRAINGVFAAALNLHMARERLEDGQPRDRHTIALIDGATAELDYVIADIRTGMLAITGPRSGDSRRR
jgi:hypothetical protein